MTERQRMALNDDKEDIEQCREPAAGYMAKKAEE